MWPAERSRRWRSNTRWCSTPPSRSGASTATRDGRDATSLTAAGGCATSTTARATTWTPSAWSASATGSTVRTSWRRPTPGPLPPPSGPAARRGPCSQAMRSSLGFIRATARWWPTIRACDYTVSNSRPRRHRLPDLLREHEAHVLLDDLELRHVRGAPRAEELDQALHELLGGAGARADANHALALQPLLAYLALVVDQVGVGPVVVGHLHQAVGVRRVLRADDQHEVALARHLAHGHLAIRGGVTDVVGAGPRDVGELLAQLHDDRLSLVHGQRCL